MPRQSPRVPASIEKPIEFRGSSLKDLREFSKGAREDCGYQLNKVQHGEQPDDFKAMASVGRGVEEIRVKDEDGTYRVIYTARFEDAVYVLHAFQKKTSRTSQHDIDLASLRFREVVKDRAAAKRQKDKS
jgi:phage-related protein